MIEKRALLLVRSVTNSFIICYLDNRTCLSTRQLVFGLKNMVTKDNYSIMILDDDEDIITLYRDYLSKMGHRIICTYLNTNSILQDIDIEHPDAYILDYKLRGNINGLEVAMEILKKFPISCIVFITAFEMLEKEISKHDAFYDKNIDILIKPVKLKRIQDSLLCLLNKLN